MKTHSTDKSCVLRLLATEFESQGSEMHIVETIVPDALGALIVRVLPIFK